MNVPVYGQSGYEVLARGIAIALHKLGIIVQIEPKMNWNKERCVVTDEEENYLARMISNRVTPDSYHIHQQIPTNQYLCSQAYSKALKTFCFSLFETNRCPAPWVLPLNQMTETWTFSKFNQKSYKESGVKKVEVIPFGINTKLFNPSVEPIDFGIPKDHYVFITNGDFTERKNFEGLIEAYVKEFNKSEKVVLVIKSHMGGFIKFCRDNCRAAIRTIVKRYNAIDPPKILFLGDNIPYTEMPRFYRAGDCFVLASRGEGLGLPYAEALACGVPVIAGDFGGQMEFLTDENSLTIPTIVRTIDDMEYIKKCIIALNHSWAFPGVADIRNRMRFAYEFRDIMREKGKNGRALMERYTWQNCARTIINRCLLTGDK